MKNFPKFLYLTNLFRLAVYFSKLISIFSKKEKKRTSFYNFFKKRKSHFDKDLLKILYKPKIFILNHDFETKNIITKQSGIINKHSHFDSDLSGVLYLKVNNNSSNSRLEIFNPFEEIDIYTFNLSLNKVEKNTFVGDKYLFSPKNNDLIIFNSYLEHSVQNKDSNISDRISLPFDLIFKI